MGLFLRPVACHGILRLIGGNFSQVMPLSSRINLQPAIYNPGINLIRLCFLFLFQEIRRIPGLIRLHRGNAL